MFKLFFRKNQSNIENLKNIDKEICNLETKISSLKESNFPIKEIIVTAILTIIILHVYKLSFLYFFILYFIFLWIYLILKNKVNGRSLRKAEQKLKKYREEQKILIARCKKDIDFSKTKELIEKYDEEEDKNSYFKMVKQRKHNGFDFLTDKIFSPDPINMFALICESCGLHNGLVDPLNSDVDYYYCYSCKHRNERNILRIKQEENKKTE